MTSFPQIDRRSKLSRQEFLDQYLLPRRPVVLTDAFEGASARHTWSLAYFRERYGALEVPLTSYQCGFVRPLRRKVRLADYIDSIVHDTWQEGWDPAYAAPYLDRWMIFDPLWGSRAADMAASFRVPAYFDDQSRWLPKPLRIGISLQIFIGPAGTIAWLHEDAIKTHAWSCNFMGRKRWLIFSPDQAPCIYAKRGLSPVDAEHPDLARFPRFRDARPLEAIQGPGDTVFVPSGWFHQVRSLEPTISLSGNFVSDNLGQYLGDLVVSGTRVVRDRLPTWIASLRQRGVAGRA